MKNYTDEELIEEIIERDLVKEVAKELDDDDVCQMVRDRDLEENFNESDFDEEDEREKLEIEVQTEWEANHHENVRPVPVERPLGGYYRAWFVCVRQEIVRQVERPS